MFNLNFTCADGGLWNMVITDAFGKEVISNTYSCNSGVNVIVTPQVKLSAGVYMVNMLNDNELVTQRFVVQ
jgi:hypothetical protein